jgi:RNA polymerase sigma factor (sigma-70 family)
MTVSTLELLNANPIDILRRDALEGAGYVERLISDRASVARWNGLRAVGARVMGTSLFPAKPRPAKPLTGAHVEEILHHGLFLPVVERRLGAQDLAGLLRSPEQLEDLARRAEEESEYFRSWRGAPETQPAGFGADKAIFNFHVAVRGGFTRRLDAAAATEAEPEAEDPVPERLAAARRAGIHERIEPGRWVFDFRVEPRALGLEDVSRELGLKHAVYLARLAISPEGSASVILETPVVLFGSPSDPKRRATGLVEIRLEEWKKQIPGLEGIKEIDFTAAPLDLAYFEAAARKPGGNGLEHEIWIAKRTNAGRTADVERALDALRSYATLKPSDDDIDVLLRAAKGGDPAAQKDFCGLIEKRLASFFSRRFDDQLQGRLDPEDLVREVMKIIAAHFQGIPDFAPKVVWKWVTTTATNTARQSIRGHVLTRKRDVRREEFLTLGDDGPVERQDLVSIQPGPETALERDDVLRELEDFLRDLPRWTASAVILCRLEGEPRKEVAEETGLSEDDLNNLLRREFDVPFRKRLEAKGIDCPRPATWRKRSAKSAP